MPPAAHSLRRRLTIRLLSWQLAALVAVAVISGFIFYYMDDYAGANFELDIAEVLADAVVVRGADLELTETSELAELRQESPALWFVIQDSSSRRLIGGEVPAELIPLAEDLNRIAELLIVGSTPEFDGAILSVEDTPIGDVRVMFGGGARPNWLSGLLSFAGREVGPVLAIIVAAIGALTILVVPRVVRASLDGLHAVERVASKIDIEQRGVRLPGDEVPSEVAGLVNAVNAALSRLDEGYEQKQRFLADAAHELRTPIAILQSRLELAPRNELDNRLLIDVHRLANLAEQLLDLQRIEHNDRHSEEVDLVPLGRQVMADLAPLAIAAGYDPVFDAQTNELKVLGDSGSLERALINLVQNAIIHGGGRGEIVMSVNADRSIAISDSGPGVPADRREWIFEPFHRIKPLNEGSGLGLSLVREIMKRHGGAVTVGDSPSGGARFLLRFGGLPKKR